jgi:hypothetical protein
VAAIPFSFLPLKWANALFVAVSTGLLAWGLTGVEGHQPKLSVFLSFGWLAAVQVAQWSPLMTAAALTSSVGFLLVCKPTLGAALFVAYPSRRAFVGVLVFTAACVAIWPWWVSAWLAAVQTTHQKPAILFWGGPVVLLALLKWRRPEARLLVGMACVPLTGNLYETVPLFLIVSTWAEGGILLALSAVVFFAFQRRGGGLDREHYLQLVEQWIVFLVYIPCTLMVLRRPNQGAVPAWFDANLTRLLGKIPVSGGYTREESAS